MKTIYRLDGKKISKKALAEMMGGREGQKRIKKMTNEAWETMMEDPYICNDFFIGHGMLNIEFQN